jgi:uncharacterized protein (TIGR03437 family)
MRASIVSPLVLGMIASTSLPAQPFFFRRDVPLTGRPASVVVGDFNGDRRPDLAIYSDYAGVVVLLNQGAGNFGRPIPTGVKLHWEGGPGVIAADFNGDGRDDLAILEGVFLSRGDGTFEPGQQFNPTSTGILAAADFNGNGKSDLVVEGLSGTQVLLSSGDGTFRAGPTLWAMRAAWAVVADFNRDGRSDVAVSQGGDVVAFLGNGDRTFGVGSTTHVDWLFSEDSYVNWSEGRLPFADFNGDGLPDLVAPHGILLGKGDGTFQPPVPYPSWGTGVNYIGVAAADFGGNGKASLILCRGGANSIYISGGKGDGSLSPAPIEQPVGWGKFLTARLATADLDGDGRLDVVVANEYSNTVSLLMGRAEGVPALRRAVSAASGIAAVAPHSLATLSAPTPAGAAATASPPWPTRLAGMSLEVRDSKGATHLAPLLSVSPTRIDFQVPDDTALGEATLAISADGEATQVGGMQVDRVSPGLFMVEPGMALPAATAVRVEADGTQVPIPLFTCFASSPMTGGYCDFAAIPLSEAGDRPIYLSFYGTGFRNANPDTVACFINGMPLPVVYAGPQGMPGLDQINVRLLPGPWEGGGIGFGFHILTISVDGVASNAAWLGVL